MSIELFDLTGVSQPSFEKGWDALVAHVPMFRTRTRFEGGQFRLVEVPYTRTGQFDHPNPLLYCDTEQSFMIAAESAAEAVCQPTDSVIFRGIVQMEDDKVRRFALCAHHIGFDGWSRVAIIRMLMVAVESPNMLASEWGSAAVSYRNVVASLARRTPDAWVLREVGEELGRVASAGQADHGCDRDVAIELKKFEVPLRTVKGGSQLALAWGQSVASVLERREVLLGVAASYRGGDVASVVGPCFATVPIALTTDVDVAAVRSRMIFAADIATIGLGGLVRRAGLDPRSRVFDSLLSVGNYSNVDRRLYDTSPSGRMTIRLRKRTMRTGHPLTCEMFVLPETLLISCTGDKDQVRLVVDEFSSRIKGLGVVGA